MKIRSTAAGAAAATAGLATTLVPHPNATASAHPAARWSATWASAMQPPVPGNDTTGPNWSGGFADQTELNPAYNSGDFLHPNDAGYRAIAAIINPNEL